jgi:peroxiredoxin
MMTRKKRAAGRRRQKKINTIVFVAGGLLVVIAAVFLLSGRPSSQTMTPAQIGKPLGDFSLTDINGKTVSLSDYAGQVVLINAWATWCPPCKAEMPDLNTYYQAHQGEGFVILAINAGDSASVAAAFANQKGLAFPVLLDPNMHLLTSLGVQSFPTSILVSADGVVKTIHVGMFTPETLEAEITPYLLK